MLPLHIWLGLIKVSMKGMCKESEGFVYLRQNISHNKRSRVERRSFRRSTNYKIPRHQYKIKFYRKRAWKAYGNVCSNFLGNEKKENYSEILQKLISSYSAVGCNMSFKLHFLLPFWFFFLKIWGLSPMNLTNVSFRIFPKLKSGTLENGFQIGWVTAAGVL